MKIAYTKTEYTGKTPFFQDGGAILSAMNGFRLTEMEHGESNRLSTKERMLPSPEEFFWIQARSWPEEADRLPYLEGLFYRTVPDSFRIQNTDL